MNSTGFSVADKRSNYNRTNTFEQLYHEGYWPKNELMLFDVLTAAVSDRHRDLFFQYTHEVY